MVAMAWADWRHHMTQAEWVPNIGDIVLTKVQDRETRVVILDVRGVRVSEERSYFLLRCRRVGTTRGRAIDRFLSQVRPTGDTVTANVFSDWLEDNGFPEAGAALRAAFPLASGHEEVG